LWLIGAVPDAAGQTQDREVPAIVMQGFETYKNQGAEAALKAWIKGGPLEKKSDLTPTKNQLKTIEDYFGSYKTYHVIFMSTPSESTKIIYLIMDYEAGPLFAHFTAFKGEEGWHIVRLNFHTDVEHIWPSFLLSPNFQQVREGR